jgi:hypothetical protein
MLPTCIVSYALPAVCATADQGAIIVVNLERLWVRETDAASCGREKSLVRREIFIYGKYCAKVQQMYVRI